MKRSDPGGHYDVIVVGSGFGGSVAALRLTEKGYRVGVLEAGRRFADDDFAATSWRLRKFLWAPRLGLYGIQRIHLLPDAIILAGAGVGGGSLNYANTLYVPPAEFFGDPQWAGVTDWASELAPYYDQASRMLGVADVPHRSPLDEVFAGVAQDMGVGHTFRLTPVGVFFGAPAGVTVPDPYFGGAGPPRTGCRECGECMTGCRHNAKNTLPKNYLGLAESAGAVVHPMTTVTAVRPRRSGGYAVETTHTAPFPRERRTFTAEHVVLPPRREHPRRARALRTRQQPDGAARHRADRRGRWHGPMEGVAAHRRPAAGGRTAGAERAALVGARRDRAGHAVGGQLTHRSRGQVAAGSMAAHVTAGRRAAEPHLDPGRQRGGQAHRGADRRYPDGPARRPHGRTHDGAFRRRLLHRHGRRARRRRRLPPGVRPRRPARRRRVGRLGQPRGQPVADHHRAGRAGDGAVAEPRGGRPSSRTRVRLRSGPGGCAGEPGGPRLGSGRPAAADRVRAARWRRCHRDLTEVSTVVDLGTDDVQRSTMGVHVSVLKKFTSLGAIVAFINSPTGQKVIGKAKDVVTDPRNREKVAEFATKMRRPKDDRV